jgi:methionine biosynthesis protein MetW
MNEMRPSAHVPARDAARVDHLLVADMVAKGARVLDVGCGDGALLELLQEERGVDARGIELSQRGVNGCVARGLSVIQGDADTDLDSYPARSFDYVILSQTLQATRAPKKVLDNMLRIGAKAIVSFPNFGYWKVRSQLFFKGRMPVTKNLAYAWHDTPNIHFCTIADFVTLAKDLDASIEHAVALDSHGKKMGVSAHRGFWNLFGEQGVFLLSRDK